MRKTWRFPRRGQWTDQHRPSIACGYFSHPMAVKWEEQEAEVNGVKILAVQESNLKDVSSRAMLLSSCR